jgi:hypothetical protein
MKHGVEKLTMTYAVVAIILIPIYVLGQGNLDFITSFSYAAFVVIPGIAALSAVICLKEAGRTWRSRYFRTWLYFSLGTFAWFAAEVMWNVYAVFLNVAIPYPSLADIEYMVGNLSFLTGLVYYYSFAKPFVQMKHVKEIFPILLATGIVLSYFLLGLSPLLVQESLCKELTDSFYLLTDSTMIFFIILSVIVFKGQKRAGAVYSILGPGVILWAVGDLLFTWSDLLGTYYNGAPLELFYLFGYLMISLAFLIHRREF